MDVMQLRRNLLMQTHSLLPAGYTQIEYLESTGTQYIATDFIPPAGVSAEWDYLLTGAFSGDKMMWGARDNTNYGRCYAERYGNNWYCGNGHARYRNVLNGKGIITSVKYHATMDSSSLVIDGNSASPTDNTFTAPGKAIFIFAWNNNGSVAWQHPVLRMYNLKFSENGVLSANFIPCIRGSDDEPGMYDTVAKKFYANAGTGTFVIPT